MLRRRCHKFIVMPFMAQSVRCVPVVFCPFLFFPILVLDMDSIFPFVNDIVSRLRWSFPLWQRWISVFHKAFILGWCYFFLRAGTLPSLPSLLHPFAGARVRKHRF